MQRTDWRSPEVGIVGVGKTGEGNHEMYFQG